jgi:hypothetical protein
MDTATVTRPAVARPIFGAQDVERYPIGLDVGAKTRRWYAEIVVPKSDICPMGTLIDSSQTLIVGDLESVGEYPAPGERELAYALAASFASPLGFMVESVWPERGYDEEF